MKTPPPKFSPEYADAPPLPAREEYLERQQRTRAVLAEASRSTPEKGERLAAAIVDRLEAALREGIGAPDRP